ncbi:LOG family protein YvdD [Symmachiella macrocystis]|uniref:Cytokinin riboside 5'-monophosphate phosphoribohydrolase n=1 Tax=Symmachiella macrocystis TaxID=2527985 RepID=A0A5C6BHG1_9PLAN|nr:LOG family protein YvdD [Symmachiella macrocystis]
MRICVFCGSQTGSRPEYHQQAAELGRLFVEQGHSLVYGGGQVGLMGIIADAVLAAGGEVVGVIPEQLATKELLHTGVTVMHRVDSMHARKAKMEQLSNAFVALPGGYGTLEELLEIITWAQLGIHRKNIGILNTSGYFDGLIGLVEHAIAESFMRPDHRKLLVVANSPTELLERLQEHELPTTRKWFRAEDS